jgi:hypothetical protein
VTHETIFERSNRSISLPPLLPLASNSFDSASTIGPVHPEEIACPYFQPHEERSGFLLSYLLRWRAMSAAVPCSA